MIRLISEGWEKLVDSKLAFIADPEQRLQKALAHIDAKRAALKLALYDPSRRGASGNWRMRELERLPLAERPTALYSTLAHEEAAMAMVAIGARGKGGLSYE